MGAQTDAPHFMESQLRLMIETAREYCVFVLDPAGMVVTWNLGAERIHGYTSDEIVGKHFSCFYPATDDQQAKSGHDLEIAIQEKRLEADGWRVRKDGSTFWAQVVIDVRLDEDRSLSGFTQITHDLTERQQYEASRRFSEFHHLLETLPAGAYTCDAEGHITYFNQTAVQVWGRSPKLNDPKDLYCGSFKLFMPDGASVSHDRCWMARTLHENKRYRGREIVVERPDGSRLPVLAYTEPFNNPQGQLTGAINILVDISNRARPEVLLSPALEEEECHSQKMEAVGQLAGGIAHEFNNLLTIISGYSEILLAQLPSNDTKRTSVKAIGDAADRAASLTRQLLAFSRQSLLEPVILDLNALVKDAEKWMRRTVRDNVTLITVLDPNLQRVRVDSRQLNQVLINLVLNACDAMPQGGRLTIATANLKLAEAHHTAHGNVLPGSYAVLKVSDTGTGIAPEIKSRIFEPFFTTKGIAKRPGLGLSMVYGIVKQSNGHIEFTTEFGVGTTFKIYLPAIDDAVTPAPAAKPYRNGLGSETILIVEAEDGVREMAVLALQSQGYKVLSAATGKDAIHVVNEYAGTINILLTDMVMPEMSGRLLAEVLQGRLPGMKVLFMSGYSDDEVVQADEELLQKPFTPTVLLRKVRQVLKDMD